MTRFFQIRRIQVWGLCLLLGMMFASAQRSPDITRVLEYRPAPGQHINRLFPTPEMSDTPEKALQFAKQQLIDKAYDAMLGLGAFGGYVIVGFDHPIVNVKGAYDFKGYGNAFKGSSESGIVMVCQDLNKNGKPDADEPWYELAGSEYSKPETIKNYEITYYRPNPDKNRTDIRWTDNQGNEGSIKHISFATQETMYPLWITENTMTFKGTKLKNTAHDTSGNGTAWKLEAFEYGYIDNHPNTAENAQTSFNIDWAVDADGNPVVLHYIDFIKVHTGQLQEAGWLGETSTELVGIEDLHPEAPLVNSLYASSSNLLTLKYKEGILTIDGVDSVLEIGIYALNGQKVASATHSVTIEVFGLPRGIYLLRATINRNQIFTTKWQNQ